MSTAFYSTALVFHVIGITIMAGTTFIDFITFRILSGMIQRDTAKSLVMGNYLDKLQRFLGIGMLLILLSGVTMMIRLHEVWGAQLWFRIKMGVLLLIIINGLGLRRSVGTKLKKALTDNTITTNWKSVQRNFTIVQGIQMALFIIIYVLSIFKFA